VVPGPVDEEQPRDAQVVDDHELAVIAPGRRRRAAGDARVGGLQQHGGVAVHAGLQHAPELHQRAGPHDRERGALGVAQPQAKRARGTIADQHVAAADEGAQARDEGVRLNRHAK